MGEERKQHIAVRTSCNTEKALAESASMICKLLYIAFPFITSYLLQGILVARGKGQNLLCIYSSAENEHRVYVSFKPSKQGLSVT